MGNPRGQEEADHDSQGDGGAGVGHPGGFRINGRHPGQKGAEDEPGEEVLRRNHVFGPVPVSADRIRERFHQKIEKHGKGTGGDRDRSTGAAQPVLTQTKIRSCDHGKPGQRDREGESATHSRPEGVGVLIGAKRNTTEGSHRLEQGGGQKNGGRRDSGTPQSQPIHRGEVDMGGSEKHGDKIPIFEAKGDEVGQALGQGEGCGPGRG